MNYYEKSLELHEQHKGKIEVISKVQVETKDDLSTAYSPGVAEPCRAIAKNPEDVYKYTAKGNLVAVVTDGTAVLGLGDIGPKAAMPVMEGKAILFKEFGDVDAFPICLDTKDTEEIIRTVKLMAPGFGGINLEDISAPRCFEIEQRLIEELDIPVFHDDQHGTAVVTLAGLINALKLTNRTFDQIKVVVNGVGAAGVAITKLLIHYGVKPENFLLCDSQGVIYEGRENLNPVKEELARITNPQKIAGGLTEAMQGADVFLGVSQAKLVTQDMVRSMAKDPIIFAMANPEPEILPEEAKAAGAFIVATGRSDFPNQVNNVLGFPGIFRGVLDAGIRIIDDQIKVKAAEAIASYLQNPTPEAIIPSPLDKGVAKVVAEAIQAIAKK